ncbi:hypothetical protein MSMEI_3858 [Mycolicibacterium smegmatis MC2 155]|uniref:Uncharacterized protein n=2 Tax=Mycolicibacterium smegmatis TaxID=1772 RepID=I7GAX6_MYCS2|nr:hypothetical protein MSMEI_3858 [Mycolicibacterium smegmatis MC2 155]SUA33918.1 Uncharacterised protein [Mycolicibacterium smegmatis]
MYPTDMSRRRAERTVLIVISHSEPAQLDLEDLAWQFLASEFTGPMYACWPIEDRLDAFLLHNLPHSVARRSLRDALMQRVMANISAAHHLGFLEFSTR